MSGFELSAVDGPREFAAREVAAFQMLAERWYRIGAEARKRGGVGAVGWRTKVRGMMVNPHRVKASSSRSTSAMRVSTGPTRQRSRSRCWIFRCDRREHGAWGGRITQ